LVQSDQVYSVGVPEEVGSFNVVGGRPCVVMRGVGPAGNALDHIGNTLVHYGSQRPLAYALDGKSKTVVLGTSGGQKETGTTWWKTTWWRVEKVGGRGGYEYVQIKVAKGALEGWYLDCADEEETVTSEGRRITIRPLVLVEKPKHIQHFNRYPVSK
jgi:hypothetical protein